MTSLPLFEVGEPADPTGPGQRDGRCEPERCRRCRRPLRDAVSLGYRIGPDCREHLGITGRSNRRVTRLARVRRWKPGDEQPSMFEQDQELNEEKTVADRLTAETRDFHIGAGLATDAGAFEAYAAGLFLGDGELAFALARQVFGLGGCRR